ncbi:hypothetical protein Tco_0998807 [Tanacetum coccineum]
MIHGRVMASKTKTMQDAIEFASKLMDKRSALLLNARLGTRGRHGEIRTHYGVILIVVYVARCNYHLDGPCAPIMPQVPTRVAICP